MAERVWQTFPADVYDDGRLIEAVRTAHETILQEAFDGDPMINPALGVECRSFRRVEDWRVMLVLTPWMLARLLFPDRSPEIGIPAGWAAEQRTSADYVVLGPAAQITLLGQAQRVHLNFHPRLGHYLLHPLCLNMQSFTCAEAVFEAWNQVIRTRDDNMQSMQRDCPLQQEVSRREFFTRFST